MCVASAARRFWVTALLFCALWPAGAVELRPDHPTEYVVQPGDTLWDIAGRFLRAPWRWREVWAENPAIANPQRIYPGDRLRVTYRDGQPRVEVVGGPRTVRLQPRVRVAELDQAIPTIPINAIAPFLSRPVVGVAEQLERAPYVVGFPDGRAVAAAGDTVFVRGLAGVPGARYDILRPGPTYRDYETGEPLGQEAIHVATARFERPGDPATLTIVRAALETGIGDRLRPAVAEEPLGDFLPQPAPPTLRGHLIAVLGGVAQIGQYQVVALDRGSQDGVASGMVFTVYRGGTARRDPVKTRGLYDGARRAGLFDHEFWYGDWQVTGWLRDAPDPNAPLPPHVEALRLTDEYIAPDRGVGQIMVFRVFPRVSFVLVLRATESMRVGEAVAAPAD